MLARRYVQVTRCRGVLLRGIGEGKAVGGRGLQVDDHRIDAWTRV